MLIEQTSGVAIRINGTNNDQKLSINLSLICDSFGVPSLQTSVVLFYNEQDSLSDQNAWDSATITLQNTVRTTSTDTRAQQYIVVRAYRYW